MNQFLIFLSILVSLALSGCGIAQQSQLNSAMEETQKDVSEQCHPLLYLSVDEVRANERSNDKLKSCFAGLSMPWPQNEESFLKASNCAEDVMVSMIRPHSFSKTAFDESLSERSNIHKRYAKSEISWNDFGNASDDRVANYYSKSRSSGNGSYLSYAQCYRNAMVGNLPSHYRHGALLNSYFADYLAFARRADQENMEIEDFDIGANRLWADFAMKEGARNSRMQAQQSTMMRSVGQQILDAGKPVNTVPSSSVQSMGQCRFNPATQSNAECHHVTAGGKCAHFGSPC